MTLLFNKQNYSEKYNENYGYLTNFNYFDVLIFLEINSNCKFDFQITKVVSSYSLILNKKRRLYLPNDNCLTISLLNDYFYGYEDYSNYLFVLIYEQMFCNGEIQYFGFKNQCGLHIIYPTYEQLVIYSIAIVHSTTTYLSSSIQLSSFDSGEKNNIKLIQLSMLSNYIFYENPFPLLFGIKLTQKMTNLLINIRLRYDPIIVHNYNFSNLVFSCFYTDEESFKLYNRNKTPLKQLEKIPLIDTFYQPVISIEENNKYNFNKYAYLIIQIEESNTTTDWNYNNIQFDISPYIKYSNDNKIYLTEKRYYYGKIINDYQLYVLHSVSNNIIIEFASCSNNNYNFSFYTKDGIPIQEKEIKTHFVYGKTILSITNRKKEQVILNVSLIEQEMDSFHIIKYSNKEYNETSFFVSNISSKYDPKEKQIVSEWDVIKNNNKQNSTIQALFYYYLFENNKNNRVQNSICFFEPPVLSIEKTSPNYNWINTSMISEGYINIIIAYFSLDSEDYLITFSPVKVDIIKNRDIYLWVILIFCFIIVIILYGTYLLYAEIRKRERKLNEKPLEKLMTIKENVKK